MGKSKGGGNAAAAEAAAARQAEEARQARIRAGTDTINSQFGSQFNDDFYAGRRTAFNDTYMPQLDKQYEDALKELTFSLARSGTTDSSIRAAKMAELQETNDRARQQLADQALSEEAKLRTSIEDARSGLISSLNATGDDSGVANAALARASALSAPTQYSALGNMFADFTGALGQQAALEKANAASGGSTPLKYNTGLFGSSGSTTVTR